MDPKTGETTNTPIEADGLRERNVGKVEINDPLHGRRVVDVNELNAADRALAEQFGYKPVCCIVSHNGFEQSKKADERRSSAASLVICPPSRLPSVFLVFLRPSPRLSHIRCMLVARLLQSGVG